MKTVLFISLLLLASFLTFLRAQERPQRTPEDIALKQTEMLVRELEIQDSVVRDTLFRMHLKFAQKRAISNTRAEALQYMQEANMELQQILTPEQYQQYMNQQVNYAPHRHRAPHNRITTISVDSVSTPPCDSAEAPRIQLPLPVSRL
jgi:Skp family chaperone for outer membrane proteins